MKKYCTPASHYALALSMVLAAGHAGAEDKVRSLSGEISAGFVAASGNSDTRTTNLRGQATFDTSRFKHHLQGRALQTRDEDETTVERYSAGYKLDFNFTSFDFAFFASEFEKDLFGGVRRRTSQTVGYGRRLLRGERHQWNAELGAGWRQLRFQTPNGERESEAIGRFSTDYRWKITDTSRFQQDLRVESGDSNTSVQSVSELQLAIIGNLAASLSYTVKYDSDVADDRDSTDTFTAVNLTYSFGS